MLASYHNRSTASKRGQTLHARRIGLVSTRGCRQGTQSFYRPELDVDWIGLGQVIVICYVILIGTAGLVR